MAPKTLILISTFFTLLLLSTSRLGAALSENPSQINSNSVLVALLDSKYTELTELIEKALLLQKLEEEVSKHNLTIFAPTNEALGLSLDPEFKRFLLEPGNINSLQHLILHHILPIRVKSTESTLPTQPTRHAALSNDHVEILSHATNLYVNGAKLLDPDSILRPDGVIHAIEKVLIPKAVERAFNNRRSLRSISAIKPEGAPEIDPRKGKKKKIIENKKKTTSESFFSIYDALAPGPALAPAPAPGPGGPHRHFDGESQVKDFVETILRYGGYNELADMLVNLTSLATEMARLVSEGYVLTVLAPNDEAMAKLTAERLSQPAAPEKILYYHILPEYQTEESMYNAVRRFGKVRYDTLRAPHGIVAQEADGSVRFGYGEDSAYLFDPDIYTDGRISVQGIDGVLFPPEEKVVMKTNNNNVKIIVTKHRRGKLLEVACMMLGAFGQVSRFNRCQ